MRRAFFACLLVLALGLTACDVLDYASSDSGQQRISESTRYLTGPLAMLRDLLLLGLGVYGSVKSKSVEKKHATTEAREYTEDEAVSMLSAIERVKAAAAKQG